MKPINIIVEASALTEERMSGIGHLTLETVRALERHDGYGSRFNVTLVAGFDRVHMLKRWGLEKVQLKAIPLPQRLINIIWKFNLLPPMDLILGRGTYIFPNYRNWWVPFSKSITFIHDISFILCPGYVAPKNQKFLEKNMLGWAGRTNKIATISQNSKEEIIENLNISEEKVSVIYPGVDTTVFYRRSDKEVVRVKNKYRISGNYLLYVGNIEPRKNLVNLMKAFRALPLKTRDKYSLVLIGGGGWLNEPIIDEIKNAQKEGVKVIHPNSFVPDEELPAFYSGASILTHPSLYEGFGLSLLQAMACGTPVIAGNNSSMPEVVGKAALLINASDTAELTAAMQKILGNQSIRRELSNKGLLRAEESPWQKTANRLLDVIGKL